MKTLFTIISPRRGHVPSVDATAVPSGQKDSRGFRSLQNKKDKTWAKRSEAGRKENVVKKRNTPKRVLTPGQNTRVYTRRRSKAE